MLLLLPLLLLAPINPPLLNASTTLLFHLVSFAHDHHPALKKKKKNKRKKKKKILPPNPIEQRMTNESYTDPHIHHHNDKLMNIGKSSAKFWHHQKARSLDSGSAGFFNIAGKATKELAGISAVAAEAEEKEYFSEDSSRPSLAKRAGPWHDASPKAAKTIPDFEQPPYCGQTIMKEPVVKDLRNRMKDETLISTHKAVEIDTRFPGLSTLEHPVGYSAEICPLEGWMMIKFVQSPLPPKKESKKELVPKIHMSDILMYRTCASPHPPPPPKK